MGKIKQFLLVIFLFITCSSLAVKISDGEKAANWKAVDLDGKIHSLSDYKGSYIMIDVWASWCGPCKQEMPHFAEIIKQYSNKNIKFISISVDANKKKWENYIKKEDIGSIQLRDPDNIRSKYLEKFGISRIPRFIIIDPNGKVVKSDAPRPSNPKLKTLLNKLLK